MRIILLANYEILDLRIQFRQGLVCADYLRGPLSRNLFMATWRRLCGAGRWPTFTEAGNLSLTPGGSQPQISKPLLTKNVELRIDALLDAYPNFSNARLSFLGTLKPLLIFSLEKYLLLPLYWYFSFVLKTAFLSFSFTSLSMFNTPDHKNSQSRSL